MSVLKEKIDLRYGIASATNESIQFGSVRNTTMLAIFMLTKMVITCTSVDNTLLRICLKTRIRMMTLTEVKQSLCIKYF